MHLEEAREKEKTDIQTKLVSAEPFKQGYKISLSPEEATLLPCTIKVYKHFRSQT